MTQSVQKALVLMAVLLVGSMVSKAEDFSADGIYYNITSETDFENLKCCLEGWNVMGDGEDSLVDFYNIVNGNEVSAKLTEKTSLEKNYYLDYGETETVNLDFSDMEFPAKKIIMVLVQPIK